MNKAVVFSVPPEYENQRLDKTLFEFGEFSSRSQAQKLVELGHVSVDGRIITKPGYKVSADEEISWALVEKKANPLEAWDYPLDIFFEDEHVLVLNKPAGMVVHPSVGHEEKTLVNALLFHCQNLSMGNNEHRPGIVHRLDKDTSGLLVVAKNNQAHAALATQFKERTVHRIYKALVWGEVRKETGEIESYLARHPQDRMRFASTQEGGKYAKTTFKVIQRFEKPYTKLELKLFTGRTHQIRVHLSEMGHPVLADPIYCRRPPVKVGHELRSFTEGLNRIALHAEELGFVHPIDGRELSFTAKWPEELEI